MGDTWFLQIEVFFKQTKAEQKINNGKYLEVIKGICVNLADTTPYSCPTVIRATGNCEETNAC
jgi:hypothetical protein